MRGMATAVAALACNHRLLRSAKISSIDSRREELRWIRSAQAGSSEGIEALFRRHWRPAYRAAYLIVRDGAAAEDIAQEAFLSAIRTLDRFDRRRPFGPWFHRIVVNRSIDWARTRALRREVEDRSDVADSSRQLLPSGPDPENPYAQQLPSALESLPPEQRAVIVLRYLLEYTPGEIAKLLGYPRGTVNSRLRRGLDQLAELLREDES
jgi:RNA polymerase sigma-70 factor, ECF subfamily